MTTLYAFIFTYMNMTTGAMSASDASTFRNLTQCQVNQAAIMPMMQKTATSKGEYVSASYCVPVRGLDLSSQIAAK